MLVAHRRAGKLAGYLVGWHELYRVGTCHVHNRWSQIQETVLYDNTEPSGTHSCKIHAGYFNASSVENTHIFHIGICNIWLVFNNAI